ncbi:SRPBCC family protein [Pseudarthrobacter sp. DSP2-3-2b1]|uniref:SRPBCC family protein n=1 Tax=Pseudarthrobacter sp. DSP2-3-2b1 TaxID=2804661 RepID=UPI003CEF36C4
MTQHVVTHPERAPNRGQGDPAPGATETAGRAFAAVFRAIKVGRPDRPIHPQGLGLQGELIRTGNVTGSSGLDWLDAAGADTVEARFSRSIGLPQGLPDILGLALRVTPSNGGIADVLFASTGWRLPGRFLLVPKLDVGSATLTTLMPYRGTKGPVLLGLRTVSLPEGSLADGEWVLSLHWAKPTGGWHQCGELRLRTSPSPADTPLRFNPLENQPPGAQTYAWTRRLRERSYRAAQRPAPAAVDRSMAGNPAPAATTGRKVMSTVSKLFNSPAEDVWKVIADGWLYSGWVVGASRIRAVDAHWPEVGSRLHHSVGIWPLVINDSSRVSAVEPGRSLELVARGWPLGEAKVIITLEDRGMQCLVTISEDATRGPGKLVPKMLRSPAIDVRNRETLHRLELMAAGGAKR